MLVKCVCAKCRHSYLADDQLGELDCPRCGEKAAGAADAPEGAQPDLATDPFLAEEPGSDSNLEAAPRFDPKAPPPMYVTRDRFLRGIVFGGLAAAFMGAVIGASLGALGVAIPAVAAALFALAAGASCRHGFGGRSARHTRRLAAVAAGLCVLFGFAGFFAGSWTVERLTGGRAPQTRQDLDEGLQALLQERARTKNAGAAIVLDQRIAEVELLRRRSDAELEDYLWVQEAQLNQPLLAYARLRATRGPVVKLGPDSEPLPVPEHAPAGALLGEVILAMWIASRGVAPRG
jgi:hypothetical protein